MIKWMHIKEISNLLLQDPSGASAYSYWERLEGYDIFKKRLLWELAEDHSYSAYGGNLIIKYQRREIR